MPCSTFLGCGDKFRCQNKGFVKKVKFIFAVTVGQNSTKSGVLALKRADGYGVSFSRYFCTYPPKTQKTHNQPPNENCCAWALGGSVSLRFAAFDSNCFEGSVSLRFTVFVCLRFGFGRVCLTLL